MHQRYGTFPSYFKIQVISKSKNYDFWQIFSEAKKTHPLKSFQISSAL